MWEKVGEAVCPFVGFCEVWVILEVILKIQIWKKKPKKANKEGTIWMQKDPGWNPGFPTDSLCNQPGRSGLEGLRILPAS